MAYNDALQSLLVLEHLPAPARHLRWLRDRLGERLAFGAVLHTGPLPFQIDDRIAALPICAIWGPATPPLPS